MKDVNFKIEFKKISDEEHISEIYFYVNNDNICLFKHNNDKAYRTTRWNLDELVIYLQDLYKVIIKDDPFPVNISGECAAELDNNARDFDSYNDEELQKYYERLNEWGYRHSWHHACSGAILADVFFRRVNDSVEISWWSDQEDEGIEFKSVYGFELVPLDSFLSTLDTATKEYNDLWL